MAARSESGSEVASRFARRKRRPWRDSLPRFDAGGSGPSGFDGVRCVGKILITAYVTAAARPTMIVMYAASSSRPRSFSKAAVE
jgi:hypothetical protein